MKPAELATEIRRIASGIENSKNPSRELVAKDIKKLISHLAADPVQDMPVSIKGSKSEGFKVQCGDKHKDNCKTLQDCMDFIAECHEKKAKSE